MNEMPNYRTQGLRIEALPLIEVRHCHNQSPPASCHVEESDRTFPFAKTHRQMKKSKEIGYIEKKQVKIKPHCTKL